jgi:hypothetical protein
MLCISGSEVIMREDRKLVAARTGARRSCEPKRLEGDHHFSGSERNLGGELSGERVFYLDSL